MNLRTTWSYPSHPELDKYLVASELCDTGHPLVTKVTEQVIGDAATAKEAALRIFYFVRDSVPHEWAGMGKKASEILIEKRGDCWLKCTLQVTMLRAANIPARFRWTEFKKTLFKGLVPEIVYQKLHENFPFHSFAEVWLGKWIKADATFDKALSSVKAKDWDGENDSEVVTGADFVTDRGTTATFEEKMDEINRYFEKTSPAEPIKTEDRFDRESEIVNLYFSFIRFKNTLEQQLAKLMSAR
jgi:transglutaminase-like putative cysteine protease